MSMIHRSCALVGRRSALIFGIARWRTGRSIEYSRHGRARTARPSHSRLVAFSGMALDATGIMRLSLILAPGAAPLHARRAAASARAADAVRGAALPRRDAVSPRHHRV